MEGVQDYAILMLEPQRRLVTWNEGAERLSGYCACEILGRHFSRFYEKGRLAQGERSPAFREFINAAGLEMKSVDEHIESIGARGEDCDSHGWARHAPASPLLTCTAFPSLSPRSKRTNRR